MDKKDTAQNKPEPEQSASAQPPAAGAPQQAPQNQQATTQTQPPASQPAADQDYNQLKAELEQTQAKLDEMANISKHALADLQNYKRRIEEEKAGFVTFANAELVSALLPSLNNIDRALKHEPKDAGWAKGVEQTFKQMTDALEKRGLQAIPAVGQKFDPRLHEALVTAPGEKDLILEELEKGWILGERVLKPARVKVGNGETTTQTETTPTKNV